MIQKLQHTGTHIPPAECASILKHVCLNKHGLIMFNSPDNQRVFIITIRNEITMENRSLINSEWFRGTKIVCNSYWTLVMKLLCDLDIPINKLIYSSNDLNKLFLITLTLMNYSNIYDINCLLLKIFFNKYHFSESSNVHIIEKCGVNVNLIKLSETFCGTHIYVNPKYESELKGLTSDCQSEVHMHFNDQDTYIHRFSRTLSSIKNQEYCAIGEINKKRVIKTYALLINVHTDKFLENIHTSDFGYIEKAQRDMRIYLHHKHG